MKSLKDQIAEKIVECNLVSHSNAFPIADVVLHVVGNGAIKALEKENARLRTQIQDAHDALSDLLCHPDGGTHRKSPKSHISVRNAIRVRDQLAQTLGEEQKP